MSNGMERSVSQRKQVKSALERIDALEQEFPRVVMAVNEAFSGQSQRVARLASVVEAVVELFGAEVVDAKIKEVSDRKTMDSLERAKAALEEGLAKGDLLKADAIGDASLIVGREFDKEGQAIFPGRVQLQFAGIKPEFQEQLRGQGVGFQVETPGEGKFEVVEIYEVVVKASEAPEALDAALEADLASDPSHEEVEA
jgi:hypothetical protein